MEQGSGCDECFDGVASESNKARIEISKRARTVKDWRSVSAKSTKFLFADREKNFKHKKYGNSGYYRLTKGRMKTKFCDSQEDKFFYFF